MNTRVDACSADILVCGFWRLSSRQFHGHGAGKSRELAGWKACAISVYARHGLVCFV